MRRVEFELLEVQAQELVLKVVVDKAEFRRVVARMIERNAKVGPPDDLPLPPAPVGHTSTARSAAVAMNMSKVFATRLWKLLGWRDSLACDVIRRVGPEGGPTWVQELFSCRDVPGGWVQQETRTAAGGDNERVEGWRLVLADGLRAAPRTLPPQGGAGR